MPVARGAGSSPADDDDEEADEYEATMEMLDAMNARAVAEADVVAPISYAVCDR